MRIAIFAIVIAYFIALIGLLRKERDRISAVLAILLTAGLVAGILKERATAIAAAATARAEEDRDKFDEKDRADRAQRDAERDRREAVILERVETLSRQATNTQTRIEVTKLQQDVTRSVSEMKIVSIHVGDDDSKSGIFKYDAPAGYHIADFKLQERSKGGDAHYEISSRSPIHVEVKWSVKSHTVRGPFHMLINTITAFLTLDAAVNLQPDQPPPAG